MPSASPSPSSEAFPTVPAALALTATAAAALAAVLVGCGLSADPAAARRAAAIAAGVAWASALLALLPVAWMAPQGPAAAATGYLLGMASRVMLCLLVSVGLLVGLRLALEPFLTALMAVQLPLLVVEACLVARHVQARHALPIHAVDPAVAAAAVVVPAPPPASPASKETPA